MSGSIRICYLSVALLVLSTLVISPTLSQNRDGESPKQKEAPSKSSECPSPTPGGTNDDRFMAFFDPHEYAWKLFLQLNRQGLLDKPGHPDPKKKTLKQYDPDTPVVWETWALASGGRSGIFRRAVPNRSELFLDGGGKPLPWGTWKRDKAGSKALEFFQAKNPIDLPVKAAIESKDYKLASKFHLLIDPTVAGNTQLAEEVRDNKCTYDFIVDNTLYNLEGLEAKVREAMNPVNANEDIIQFPVTSQIAKAKWVRLTSERDKLRYHWRTIAVKDSPSGKSENQIWGLAGLHITTKDIPNWFWCTFEHVDTEVHAELASEDSTTRGPKARHMAPKKPGVRDATEGSKWEFYRLRGTQVEFTTARRPTLLANTQIEHGFQQSSSCMTCHSRATVGLREHRPDLAEYPLNLLQTPIPNTLPTFLEQTKDFPPKEIIRFGPVGAPDPNWFRSDRFRLRYIQSDFLWQMPFRALSTKDVPPKH